MSQQRITNLEYVLLQLETYLDETIIPIYEKQKGGLQQHHLVFVLKDKIISQKVQATELAPDMINCVMQELNQDPDIHAFIIYSDGLQVLQEQNDQASVPITQHPDRQRVLKIILHVPECSLVKTHIIQTSGDHYKVNDECIDNWYQPQDNILGYPNPYFSQVTMQKIPATDIMQVVRPIKERIKAAQTENVNQNKQ